jgi:MFS family permease
MKMFVALQVSWLGFIGPMGSAVANPAFVPLGKAFHHTPLEISYELTVYIIFAGVGPLFIAPLSNVYGRRPIYLLGNLLAAICNVVAGYCTTWTGILVTRVFTGIGSGSTVAIGAATICDMYFLHERGLYMGIYAFFLTNGPHIAPLIGGFIAENLGWRDCFTTPVRSFHCPFLSAADFDQGYIQLGTFAVTLFCLPETLYHRQANSDEYKPRSYIDMLLFKLNKNDSKGITAGDFLKPFYMMKYISVFIPALYYMTCFGYGTVLFALTGAQLFAQLYHFTVPQTGLILSIPLTIGCLIGECSAGWVTDLLVRRYAMRNDGHRKPEVRIDALWLGLLIPVGVIIVGVCFSHYKTVSWLGPAFGMGIACLGLQVSTTVVYTYTTDVRTYSFHPLN